MAKITLTVDIDTRLFAAQRQLLLRITDLARRNLPYTAAPGDKDLLDGLLELTDALADAPEDRSA